MSNHAHGATYTDLNNVPEPFRKLSGAKLSLEHINWLSQRSAELGAFKKVGDGEIFEPDEGAARVEFAASHHIEGSIWVEGPPPVVEAEVIE